MRREMLIRLIKLAVVILATAYLFFYSLWSLVFLIPYLGYEIKKQKQELNDRRRRELAEQFQDGLQCLLASLEAGYSVENSFLQAASDLRAMYSEHAPIVREFDRIKRHLGNGQNIEELVLAMGERNEIEDIRNFAAIFVTAKRTGGDIISVIRSVTADIYQKLEVRREIETVLLAKMLEVRIMKVMPYVILAYFRIFSPDFLAPLYSGVFGRIVMIAAFVFYLSCVAFADRTVKISV